MILSQHISDIFNLILLLKSAILPKIEVSCDLLKDEIRTMGHH